MKKAIVQFVSSNKFLVDTVYSEVNDTHIYGINLNQNLYKNVFYIKPDYLFFSGHNLTEEIISFLDDCAGIDTPSNIKIYICWTDNISYKHLTDKYNIVHLMPYNENENLESNKIIYYPNNLINDSIYHPTDQLKENTILGFLENITEIPNDLEPQLYPKKLLPIKLFNNPNIHTIHNLGIITELDKAKLLQQSKYYLKLANDTYALSANACGCIILEPSELDNISSAEFTKTLPYISHAEFLDKSIFI